MPLLRPVRPVLAVLALLLAALLHPAVATAASDGGAAGAAGKPASGKPVSGKPGSGKAKPGGKAKAAKGAAWPKGRVRYLDRTEDPEAVRLAAAIWNRSGLKVRLVPTRKQARARLVLGNDPALASGCGTGRATQGYPGRRGVATIVVRSGPDSAGQACATPGQTLTLVRLLGRALGLADDDGGCAAMNSSVVGGVAPARCLTPQRSDDDDAPGRWRCAPLTSRDLAQARALYGGRPRPVPADPWCVLVAPMAGAGALSIAPDADGDLVASMTRVAEPALPSYLQRDSLDPEWELHQSAGACTAVPGGEATLEDGDAWTVAPGQVERLDLFPVAAGPVCFTLFVTDRLGRYAAAGTSVVHVVTPQELDGSIDPTDTDPDEGE